MVSNIQQISGFVNNNTPGIQIQNTGYSDLLRRGKAKYTSAGPQYYTYNLLNVKPQGNLNLYGASWIAQFLNIVPKKNVKLSAIYNQTYIALNEINRSTETTLYKADDPMGNSGRGFYKLDIQRRDTNSVFRKYNKNLATFTVVSKSNQLTYAYDLFKPKQLYTTDGYSKISSKQVVRKIPKWYQSIFDYSNRDIIKNIANVDLHTNLDNNIVIPAAQYRTIISDKYKQLYNTSSNEIFIYLPDELYINSISK